MASPTTTSAALQIIGDRELVERLTRISKRTELGKIARRSVNRGLTVIVVEMKRALPPVKSQRRVRRGKSRRRRAAHSNVKTRRSIGKAFRRGRSSATRGRIEAKAGFKVGKPRNNELAHVHLRFTGTIERRRGSGGRTGRVVAVAKGYASSVAARKSGEVTTVIADTVEDGLITYFRTK